MTFANRDEVANDRRLIRVALGSSGCAAAGVAGLHDGHSREFPVRRFSVPVIAAGFPVFPLQFSTKTYTMALITNPFCRRSPNPDGKFPINSRFNGNFIGSAIGAGATGATTVARAGCVFRTR
jgi:hypothetical protein